MATSVKKYLKKANKKIDFLFKKMQGYIKEIDFFNIEERIFGNPEPNIQESNNFHKTDQET